MSKKGEEENLAWRNWMFGDVSADTHHFLEKGWKRAGKEIGCAFAASSLVSPIVSVIDKCIAMELNGTAMFMKAVGEQTREMFVQPKTFFTAMSFRLTWVVYFGTYAVANLSEMFLDQYKIRNDTERKQYKVGASAVANISLLAWRDSVFARAFGKGTAKSTPMRTIGLFAVRDTATMYATFYAAPEAAKYCRENFGMERNVAELSTALGVPVVFQFVTAPLHIHALDYFNRREATFAERMTQINKEMGTVCFARGIRILPAFGLGSFSNNKFRELFIRQPNEELLLTRRVTVMMESTRRRLTRVN